MSDHESLFGELPTSYARLSDDELYRYTLGRRWGALDDRGAAVFVMLNPSTADATLDDPTVRRCIGFAKSLGCGGVHVVNLYAYRATRPSDLWKAADPVGPENDEILRGTFRAAHEEMRPIIAAWGANAKPERVQQVVRLAGSAPLSALGVTKDGHPRHPLYLRRDATPEPWSLS